MSLVPGVNNPAIDNLVQSSLESDIRYFRLEWIPCSEITDITSSPMDNVYYAILKRTRSDGRVDETMIMLLLLEECIPAVVSEFARIYSLPTHKYRNDIRYRRYRRYSYWLSRRNTFIRGFTKYDDKYYMVAWRDFYQYYSRYGFCAACGILRCSVWCICGHKQLSDGWTSNNSQLDDFIKKSQLQTNSPNDAYLEWIPFDCIYNGGYYARLYSLPTPKRIFFKLIPLEIMDETHDLYYAEVNHLLMRHVY